MVLNGDSPNHILFLDKPLFPLEPHLFDSTCYVHNVQPHIMKLDPKALKCVFWDILIFKRDIDAILQNSTDI